MARRRRINRAPESAVTSPTRHRAARRPYVHSAGRYGVSGVDRVLSRNMEQPRVNWNDRRGKPSRAKPLEPRNYFYSITTSTSQEHRWHKLDDTHLITVLDEILNSLSKNYFFF